MLCSWENRLPQSWGPWRLSWPRRKASPLILVPHPLCVLEIPHGTDCKFKAPPSNSVHTELNKTFAGTAVDVDLFDFMHLYFLQVLLFSTRILYFCAVAFPAFYYNFIFDVIWYGCNVDDCWPFEYLRWFKLVRKNAKHMFNWLCITSIIYRFIRKCFIYEKHKRSH